MDKKITISIVAAIIILLSVAGYWGFIHRKKISNELARAYWDYRRYGIGPGLSVQTYAGCQMKAMIDTKTDEEFSAMWKKESKEEHFDAIDVDRYMLKRCPPRTSEEIKNGWNEYFKDKDYSDMNEEEEKIVLIERSISISKYQRKFLNREFTALKDEPRE